MNEKKSISFKWIHIKRRANIIMLKCRCRSHWKCVILSFFFTFWNMMMTRICLLWFNIYFIKKMRRSFASLVFNIICSPFLIVIYHMKSAHCHCSYFIQRMRKKLEEMRWKTEQKLSLSFYSSFIIFLRIAREFRKKDQRAKEEERHERRRKKLWII
jgi:hypothetical protein